MDSTRWLALAEEIATHDQHLTRLTTKAAPRLLEGFGVGAHTAAQMLIIFGDNPDRIRSEAAFAKLCGACPIPASSGMTTGRHRLYRGGHRQANAALHRTVVVRMRLHQPTVDDVARRTAGGRTRREIIRCLKRFLAREIYQRVMADFRMRRHVTQAAETLVLTYRGVNTVQMPSNQSGRIRTSSIISVSTPSSFPLRRSQRRSPSIRSIAIAPSRVASSDA